MRFSLGLSKFSIRNQILIGYIPVFIILIFLAFSSFLGSQKFDLNFYKLKNITKENIAFTQIERDIVELQRNVLVYSYVGYKGVLRKIEFLQESLEEKFDVIRPIVTQEDVITERYERMAQHYKDYNEGFKEAVAEKERLENLTEGELKRLAQKIQGYFKDIERILIEENDYEGAFLIGEIQNDFLQANVNINTFKNLPDAILIKDTRSIVFKIRDDMFALQNDVENEDVKRTISQAIEELDKYKDNFKKIVNVAGAYIHLLNVVLAGKAAEIDKLSGELDELVSVRSQVLANGINDNIKKAQRQYVLLALIAGLIGFVSLIVIAMGIAGPVSRMASTLSVLSRGEAEVEIPGQDRKDEVGKMAGAANEFKIMAQQLAVQTAELEEFAYRTSHDLRSPLLSSISLLSVAKNAIDSDEDEKARRSLDLAQSSLQKLETLVKDILELTKTKNAQEGVQPIHIEDIVEETLQKLSHMDGYERLDIQKSLRFDGAMLAQKGRIVLIVENLISNAIKYQDMNKDEPIVKIETYSDKQNFVLAVEDNGLGIPKEQHKNLFTMFKRFHPKASFGSGLGLYMMKKSADILGGRVEFIDVKDGARFELTIPLSEQPNF